MDSIAESQKFVELEKMLKVRIDINKISKEILYQLERIEIKYIFDRQTMMEYLMEIVDDVFPFEILYFSKSKDMSNFDCISFCKPVENTMFLFRFQSNKHGIVDGFSMAVYESIEKLYYDVNKIKNRIDNYNKTTITLMSQKEIDNHFIS